jgi:hypothetical protein
LFDKLKLEVSNFKSGISSKYKEHLNLLQSIPDVVDMEPQKLAEIISAKIENEVNIDSFIFYNKEPECVQPELIEEEPLEDLPIGFSIKEPIDEE